MNVTFGFLVTGKERVRKPLEVSTFFFEKGNDLFARCSVNTLVGDMTFPVSDESGFVHLNPDSEVAFANFGICRVRRGRVSPSEE